MMIRHVYTNLPWQSSTSWINSKSICIKQKEHLTFFRNLRENQFSGSNHQWCQLQPLSRSNEFFSLQAKSANLRLSNLTNQDNTNKFTNHIAINQSKNIIIRSQIPSIHDKWFYILHNIQDLHFFPSTFSMHSLASTTPCPSTKKKAITKISNPTTVASFHSSIQPSKLMYQQQQQTSVTLNGVSYIDQTTP